MKTKMCLMAKNHLEVQSQLWVNSRQQQSFVDCVFSIIFGSAPL